MSTLNLTGVERYFSKNDIIVSKTDVKGRITYANPTFLGIAGYNEKEVLTKPHNLIRHPDMPRCVFKLLWDTISAGQEIFAYVINRSKNGDHYWVLAHVTPDFDMDGKIIGYHSSRRTPRKDAIEQVNPLYKILQEKEESFANRKEGITAASDMLTDLLQSKGVRYDQFIFSL